jgi:hypothetical protein
LEAVTITVFCVYPDYKENTGNADVLTNGKSNVRASGMSGQFSSEGSVGERIEGEL